MRGKGRGSGARRPDEHLFAGGVPGIGAAGVREVPVLGHPSGEMCIRGGTKSEAFARVASVGGGRRAGCGCSRVYCVVPGTCLAALVAVVVWPVASSARYAYP